MFIILSFEKNMKSNFFIETLISIHENKFTRWSFWISVIIIVLYGIKNKSCVYAKI